MWKLISENKLSSGLISAYLIAMTVGVITNAKVNWGQDIAHVAEVTRSTERDEKQGERITFSITKALEARDMAIQNGAAVGIHHNNANHHTHGD